MSYCARLLSNARRAVSCHHVVHAVCVLVLLLALPFLAHGQEATIVGTVTDPSGGVVPNVKITITNASTGVVRTITSNDVGQYVVPDLIVGKYNDTVVATALEQHKTQLEMLKQQIPKT